MSENRYCVKRQKLKMPPKRWTVYVIVGFGDRALAIGYQGQKRTCVDAFRQMTHLPDRELAKIEQKGWLAVGHPERFAQLCIASPGKLHEVMRTISAAVNARGLDAEWGFDSTEGCLLDVLGTWVEVCSPPAS